MAKPEARPLTLGTAGHVDHGKTALIRALTGTDTDRLPEERRRGLTIELGFAELALPDGRRLSVVDVPGHERFVRTMVAGASGIDLYLLVVAADDGVMPQTGEHWAVLRALDIDRGVVAITKCDRAEPEQLARARAGARALVGEPPIVEVSAVSGSGLGELCSALAVTATQIDPDRGPRRRWPEEGPLLHVDRSFTLRGIGTVVTGTLWSGSVGRGDRLKLLPSGKEARVRSVQVHDRELERAAAGQRVALNLAGIERREVERGDVLAGPSSTLEPTYRLDAALSLEPGTGDLVGERLHVHHGTRDAPARLVVVDERRGFVQLRLEVPLIARAGDRFVMRRIAPPDTLGGGAVLDPRPHRHGPGPAAERLRLISEGEPEALIERALGESEEPLPADPHEWISLPVVGPALHRFPPARWQRAAVAVVEAGLARAEAGLLGPPRRNRRRAEDDERRAPPLSAPAVRALALLERDGPEPRSPQALADALGLERGAALALLEELVRAGRAVRVKPGIYYPPAELERLCSRALQLATERGSITIAELRDALASSRKYAQAMLEYLDAQHATLRKGDRHVVRRHAERGDRATLQAGRQESGGSAGLQSQ